MNDYIPSNRHGDYLMHYGIKGMKWKDHDYVEDFKDNWKSGYGMIKSSAKSNLKKLKKLVGKAKSEVIKKVDPKLRERDYVKNHKVHEEQDKREASEKMTQAKMMKNRMSLPTTRNVSNAASVSARAGVLDDRARLSAGSKDNKERLSRLRTTNANADKTVKDAERKVMKSEYGIGQYNASAHNVMREWHMRHDSKLGVQATAQNKLRKEISQTDSKRTSAANTGANKGMQAVANNRVSTQQNSRSQAQSSAANKYVNNNRVATQQNSRSQSQTSATNRYVNNNNVSSQQSSRSQAEASAVNKSVANNRLVSQQNSRSQAEATGINKSIANNRVASQQSSRNQAQSSAAKQGTLAVNNNKIKEDLKKRKRK